MRNRLKIRLVTGEADEWTINDIERWEISEDTGMLVLYDKNNQMSVVYPPGAWLSLVVEDV